MGHAACSENGFPLKPPVIVEDWGAFAEWVKDAGYDESYLNRYDSKCLALQEQFLEEERESAQERDQPVRKPGSASPSP